MNATDPIIQAALLGTAAKEFVPEDLPAFLSEAFRPIRETAGDAEEALYRMAALTFASQRAGLQAGEAGERGATAAPVDEAQAEERPYFSRELANKLEILCADREQELLLYAYRRAAADKNGRLIPPLYLPGLIAHAFDRNLPLKYRGEERELLGQLAGRRGAWLLRRMGLDASEAGEDAEETWETASHEARKRILHRVRTERPAEGLALLQSELKSESAAHREELIRELKTGLNLADEPFLTTIADKDRGQAVRQAARELLFRLPGGGLVGEYADLLRGKIRYNRLTGWSYDPVAYTPRMKELGLEELSPNKKEKDAAFLLRQLAERMPLGFWAELFGCEAEEAAERLARKPPFGDFFDLAKPILNFEDRAWAYHTLRANPTGDHVFDLLGLLSPEQREEIDLRTDDEAAGVRLTNSDWLWEDDRPWGPKFSARIVERLIRDDRYCYDPTVKRLAVLLDRSVLPLLDRPLADEKTDNAVAWLCQTLKDNLQTRDEVDRLIENA